MLSLCFLFKILNISITQSFLKYKVYSSYDISFFYEFGI